MSRVSLIFNFFCAYANGYIHNLTQNVLCLTGFRFRVLTSNSKGGSVSAVKEFLKDFYDCFKDKNTRELKRKLNKNVSEVNYWILIIEKESEGDASLLKILKYITLFIQMVQIPLSNFMEI